jgi:GTP-binding protein
VHVLLTKSDKLSRGESTITLNKVRKELQETWGDEISVQLFSSLKKQGVDEAEKVLGEWFLTADTDPAAAQPLPD